MTQLIYLDFLRKVSPCKQERQSFDFMIFGGFDALRVVHSLKSLKDMKLEHGKGHQTIDTAYDRQPVFLYSDRGWNEISELFAKEGELADRPIVITILQIQKKVYAAKATGELADDLIKSFSGKVARIIKEKNILLFHWSVFWNLGESDIVIVFRPDRLADAASIIHGLRMDPENDLAVMSSCSHCGFPYQKTEIKTKQAIIRWLDREKDSTKNSKTQGLLSFLNTSSAYHHLSDYKYKTDNSNNLNGTFLFGEWDYSFYWNLDKDSEQVSTEKIADKILESAYATENGSYKTSYTLPAVQLEDLGNRHGVPLNDDTGWIGNIQPAYIQFVDYLKSVTEYPTAQSVLVSIASLGQTITGLAKYLYRLYLGRFEEDLYAYVKPIFCSIPGILKSYQEEINRRLNSEEDALNIGRDTHRLITEMVQDTTAFISGLQHMFSVLAVSPHTFMETFGSNMRSLSAADKLVDAYQGLTQFLNDCFRDVIQDGLTGRHHILILPYREAYPLHTLLFASSSPLCRISTIRMDFQEMFSLENSIYALLHECGHHLGDRLRAVRRECYFHASYLFMAEKTIGKFLYKPFSAMISVVEEKEINAEKAKLLYGIPEREKKEIIKQFSERIRKIAWNTILELAKNTEKAERKSRSAIEKKLVPRHNHLIVRNSYSVFVQNYVQNFFFSVRHHAEADITADFRKTIHDCFLESMRLVAVSLMNVINETGGDVYEASRIYAKYATEEMQETILSSLFIDLDMLLLKEEFAHLMSVFSEIYADIFTIRILDIQHPRDYYMKIPVFSGSSSQEASINPMNILRIVTISRICFGEGDDKKDREMLSSYIKSARIAAWQKDKVEEIWNQIVQSVSFRYTCEYAEACNQMLFETVNCETIRNLREISALRDVFNDPTRENEIHYIEMFWRYLMSHGQA